MRFWVAAMASSLQTALDGTGVPTPRVVPMTGTRQGRRHGARSRVRGVRRRQLGHAGALGRLPGLLDGRRRGPGADHAREVLPAAWPRVLAADNRDAYVYRMLVNCPARQPPAAVVAGAVDRATCPTVRWRDATAGVDTTDAIHRALGQARKVNRDVVVLRYFAHLSEAQTAEVLGVPPAPSRAGCPARWPSSPPIATSRTSSEGPGQGITMTDLEDLWDDLPVCPAPTAADPARGRASAGPGTRLRRARGRWPAAPALARSGRWPRWAAPSWSVRRGWASPPPRPARPRPAAGRRARGAPPSTAS